MKTAIRTEAAPAAIGPYSQAIKVGNLLFASGQIPLRPDGTLVSGDIKAQTEQVIQNIQAVLAAAGLGLGDVVKTTCFLQDLEHFAAFNEVYGRYFAATPPARSTVEVARLPKDVLVEIEVVAVAP